MLKSILVAQPLVELQLDVYVVWAGVGAFKTLSHVVNVFCFHTTSAQLQPNQDANVTIDNGLVRNMFSTVRSTSLVRK